MLHLISTQFPKEHGPQVTLCQIYLGWRGAANGSCRLLKTAQFFPRGWVEAPDFSPGERVFKPAETLSIIISGL
jgi:hypothetical protein